MGAAPKGGGNTFSARASTSLGTVKQLFQTTTVAGDALNVGHVRLAIEQLVAVVSLIDA